MADQAQPRTVSVKNKYVKNFSNPYHVQFHFQQHELIARMNREKINVSEQLLKEWEDCIALETDINKRTLLSEVTKKMDAQDKVRDDILNNIFGVIRSQRFSPSPEIKEAAEKLHATFKPYYRIQAKSYPEESAGIRGMIADTPNFKNEIEKLGLKKSFELLKQANDDFETLRMQRQDDAIDNKLPPAREVRKHTDEVYEEICQCIAAAYITAATPTEKDNLIVLVDGLNLSGTEVRKSYKESVALQKKAKEEEDKKKEEEKKKKDNGKIDREEGE